MGIFYDVAQGSDRWTMLRMGRPCASEFHNIITVMGKLRKGDGVDTFENRLIAEIMLMSSIRTIPPTYAMERGKNLEPEARDAYEFITGNKVIHGGFWTDDKGQYGASPDGIIEGKNLGLELKCPLNEEKHIGYLLNNQDFVDEHKCQVQGQILTAGFDGCDMVSYFPGMPRVIVHVEPDLKFIKTLKEGLGRCGSD